MLHLRPLLALVLLVVLTGGSVAQQMHRTAHAAEAATEEAAHVAAHHEGHDHAAPGVEAPCPPELAEPDCAVCALSQAAPLLAQDTAPLAPDGAPRLQAEARTVRMVAASAGARGPPQV